MANFGANKLYDCCYTIKKSIGFNGVLVDQKQLRDHLQQLNDSIENLSGIDGQQRQQLQALIDQIEQQLAADALTAQRGSLSDQVDELVTEFDTEHPTISGILNNILITLGNMGI